ncbi:activating signal cointegrator 1 isoform X2 [Adelges cooleyi]|uniref:activating signal cointegrator 1 isoform X2 n=1 Tax=Adelges cooleyi TaxID=133065 RepID=UPI00217FCBA5|nr:activating signal cointegrator 1 isoform X2 [Adelges cooleyi]
MRWLSKYILSMQSEKDLEEYCNSLLDLKSSIHKQFLSDLKKRFRLLNQKPATGIQGPHIKLNQPKNNKNQDQTKDAEKNPQKSEPKSKNKKYVNIFSDEGINQQEIFLKGRHKCDCQASKHGLINNCLSCGRIVCKQEGSGPCVVCGELVCSNDEKLLLNCNNNKSKELYNQLIELTVQAKSDIKALEHRNKLLEYDRTSAKRTNVIDDQMDYYSVNSGWLSAKQKDQMKKKSDERQEKLHGSRRAKKFTIDFAGRQVYEDEELDDEENEDSMNDCEESQFVEINEQISNPLIKIDLKFNNNCIKTIKKKNSNPKQLSMQETQGIKRVQDAELMLMTDSGMCMSMHQPYASLLLLNIKCHEGRSWYTSHRGRLWIASTSKKPTPEEVERLESFYKYLKGDMEFPKRYPTSCLMGCVNVVDCLSQEEYMEQYPQGECESPFVFICKDPVMMANQFPIKGQHKIYKLDEKIHTAAQKCLTKQKS